MSDVRLRFPKSARLARASEFLELKRSGNSFHGRFMVLSVLRREDGAGTRAGIITSRRVGPAVVRNRVRRRFRELLRATRPELYSGYWMVLVARQHSASATFAQLQGEWRHLARKSGLLATQAPCSS